MMPMLDIQRRHAEVFRIRLGEKGPKGEPRKLTDAIRVTSPNERVVQAFADVFGGDPRPWAEQYEVHLPVTSLPVMILPGESIQQWWELWKSRNEAVCERRCDGYTESLSGKPCMCPEDVTVRMMTAGACRPMTRLSIICPDVEVIGAGSLVTHGMIAAETLPQSVMVAQEALARGLMVPAIFRVVEHKGKRHYIVPQLEIVGLSLTALTTGEPVRALENGRKELAPPGPAALPSGGGTAEPEKAAGVAGGRMEAPPDMSPGVQPGGQHVPPASNGPRRPASKPPLKQRSEAPGEGAAVTPPAAASDPDAMTEPQNRKMHALFGGLGISDAEQQRSLIGELLNREVDSRGSLSKSDASAVIDGLIERQQQGARR